MTRVAYLTGFDPRIFPRPIFFVRATGAKIYQLRTLVGHLRNPNKRLEDFVRQQQVIKQRYINLLGLDISKYINNCYRQDRTYIFGALIKEAGIAGFLEKLRQEYDLVIIKNLIGVLAAKLAGIRVMVDLMDLWHCDRDYLVFSLLDFVTLRKAECVIAWSKAIAALLRRVGLKCVEYLPFGVDLNVFDPLKADPKLIYERYPQLEGKVVVGYSGGGHIYHGIHKVLAAYRLVEKKNKDVVLAIQTWGQNQLVRDMIKRFNIERAVLIEPTKLFNDPLRLSFLRAASILVLPVSKTPGVYLAERTTMYQFMAAGNAIVAEYSPGVAGVLKDGHTAAIAKHGDVRSFAEKIEFLVTHGDVAEEMGRNVRKEVEEKYSWSALAPKAREIINRVAR
jgi:glycosyltransferase involved in cell wall biosynthesis